MRPFTAPSVASKMMSINAKEVPLFKLAAEVAADLRSVELGKRVSCHAVYVEAMRIGLGEILGVHPDEFLEPVEASS